MNNILSRSLLGFVLLTQTSLSYAVVEFVRLQPARPHAEEPVGMILYFEGCDGLFSGQEVSESDHMVRVIVDGVRAIDPFCLIPPSEVVYPIGAFEAGAWTLQIDYRYEDPVTVDIVIETIDTITFDVLPSPAGAAPTPVPTLGWWGKLGLALLALAAAVHAASRRIIRSRTRTRTVPIASGSRATTR